MKSVENSNKMIFVWYLVSQNCGISNKIKIFFTDFNVSFFPKIAFFSIKKKFLKYKRVLNSLFSKLLVNNKLFPNYE